MQTLVFTAILTKGKVHPYFIWHGEDMRQAALKFGFAHTTAVYVSEKAHFMPVPLVQNNQNGPNPKAAKKKGHQPLFSTYSHMTNGGTSTNYVFSES